jgi:hypothetical protein
MLFNGRLGQFDNRLDAGKKYKVGVGLHHGEWGCNHQSATKDLYVRAQDDSRDALLRIAAQIIFDHMKLEVTRSPFHWQPEFPIDFLRLEYVSPARQPADCMEPVWIWIGAAPKWTVDMDGRYQIIRRPGSVPIQPEQKSLVGISGDRPIDVMSWDEFRERILDSASREG